VLLAERLQPIGGQQAVDRRKLPKRIFVAQR
jgi:hypothetical protein